MDKALELLKSLKFLEAVCYIVGALLVVFVPDHAVESSVLLAAVVAVLKLFGIQPEREVNALLKERSLLKTKKK